MVRNSRFPFLACVTLGGVFGGACTAPNPTTNEVRTPVAGTSNEPKDNLPSASLKYLGSVHLDSRAPRSPTVRDILDWDIDGEGRIGFLRLERGDELTFVLVTTDGKTIAETPLNIEMTGLSFQTFRWFQDDVWALMVSAEEYPGIVSMWLVSGEHGAFKGPISLDCTDVDSMTTDRHGRLLAYSTVSMPTEFGFNLFQYSRITAYDANGNQLLRVDGTNQHGGPTLPFSASICSTSDRRIVLRDQNNGDLLIFDQAGVFQGLLDSGSRHHCIPDHTILIPDFDGGLLVCQNYTNGPLHRVRQDEIHSARMPVPGAWYSSLLFELTNVSTTTGYPRKEILPHFKKKEPELEFRSARMAPDDACWISDGNSFYELDDEGTVVRGVGEDPAVRSRLRIGERYIDREGRTYLANAPTGMVDVFDRTGKFIYAVPRSDSSFESRGLDWSTHFRLMHPRDGQSWEAMGSRLRLKSADGAISREISKRPDGGDLSQIVGMATAGDGSIAVIARKIGRQYTRRYTLNVYGSAGEPIKTIPLVIEHRPDKPTFDGRHFVYGSWWDKDIFMVDVSNGSTKTLQLRDGDGRSGNRKGAGFSFYSMGGTELWVMDARTLQIDRYVAP